MSAALLHSARLPNGRSYMAVIAKRAYQIVRDREATPLDEQIAVVQQPVHVPSVNGGAEPYLIEDSDLFCVAKETTDVVMDAYAHAPGHAQECVETTLVVGSAQRRVRVWGDRVIRCAKDGSWSFSPPEPFRTKRITLDHAYGGRDLHAERRILSRIEGRRPGQAGAPTLAYPRNGAGRGYFIGADARRADGTLAPNLEDPADPVTPDRLNRRDGLDWPDAPTAAGYGPIHALTFPRTAYLLPIDYSGATNPLHEVRTGVLTDADVRPRDLTTPPNPLLFNCAPAGLARCRLGGGERVRLENLHPDAEVFEFLLPRGEPQVKIAPPNVGWREVRSLLQLVRIEPDQGKVTLTWAATMEVAAPFPDAVLADVRHSIDWSRS